MHRSSLSALIFAVLLMSATGVHADEPPDKTEASENSSRRIVVGAQLAWSWLVQYGGTSPLCCGERDEWTVSGPQVGVTAAYEVWSWMAVGMKLRLGSYGDVIKLSLARRIELVDIQAGPFVDFILVRRPFELALGIHAAQAWLNGEMEDRNDRVKEIDETLHPIGLHLKLEVPVGRGVAVGLAASTQYYPANSVMSIQGMGLSVSWSP